jgi:ubiquinone/menaquinone biosynthesis C-methylase UbiE
MKDWYKSMFEGNLARYWLSVSDRREEATDIQFSFLRDVLKKGLVLDHCCGYGRLSIRLSAYTPVVGLDLSIYLLQAAKKKAKQANTENLQLVRGDMRYLPFKLEVFDAVINVWTSFGYFSEEENENVLREIAAVLKSRGTFVLDIVNPGWLLRNFVERDWTEDESYLSMRQRSIDWKTKRMRCKWIIVNKQTREIDQISFDHRLYDMRELRELLNREGLETVQIYGSFEKEDFDEAKSNRIIILSRKGGNT